MDITQFGSLWPGASAADRNGNIGATTQNRQWAEAVRYLNQHHLAGSGRELTLSIDDQTRQPVIRVVDSVTKAVLEQMPTEDALRLAQYFSRTNTAKSAQIDRPAGR